MQENWQNTDKFDDTLAYLRFIILKNIILAIFDGALSASGAL
jgi:hypothetical protein